MNRIGISSFTLDKLTQFVVQCGQPAFRAKQLFSWLHEKRVTEFSAMTNLPKAFVQQLEQQCKIETLRPVRRQCAKDGTVKYLFALSDGNCIETVLMRYSYGNSVCVSTQVGCRMGCRFCASTQGGRVRNLTAGEIAGEIYAVMADTGERVSHIVLMGIGEPLDNFDNVMDFLSIISCPQGVNIGMRNISLSTCGLVPMIEKLAQKKLGLTLSISLHALAKLIDGMGAHVNLIPINPVDGSPYSAADSANVKRFQNTLLALGVNATVRRRLGTEISAACGQLRREASKEGTPGDGIVRQN